MLTHLRPACLLIAALAAASAAHADIYNFTVNSQASSLQDSVNISTPLTGSLIGNYDATANPSGTQTRTGLFGGTGNNEITTTGTLSAVDNTTTHPAGTFSLDVNASHTWASISGLNLDYLNGQHPDILLNIAFQFATFHTVAPTALYPGNIPVTLPLGEVAHFDSFSVAQFGIPAIGQLRATATPNQFTYSTLIPVRLTITGSVLNNPITGPVTLLLPFSATITFTTPGAATATWSADSTYNNVIPGPIYTVTNQALDVPTVLPPGGTAHLLLNGDFGDLTIALAAQGNIQAAGQRQATCPADFNGDGRLNVLDFLAFLNAFSSGDPRADFNHDGQRNILDFITFLNNFAMGC